MMRTSISSRSALASLISQGSLQAACIAISSRLVGSTFRFLETLNPKFQQSRVISDPQTVLIREVSTLGMAWGFALITNALIAPLARKRGWRNFSVQFLTAVIGTTLAEGLGRAIAYSQALQPMERSTRQPVPTPSRRIYRPKALATHTPRGLSAPPIYSVLPSAHTTSSRIPPFSHIQPGGFQDANSTRMGVASAARNTHSNALPWFST